MVSIESVARFYRANFPLHVSYTTSQLDFAVAFLQTHPSTRLVTINLGGNDLGLVTDQCDGQAACITAGLPALRETLARNLETIYARIRNDGHYQGQLIALTLYPLPLANPPGQTPLYSDEDVVTMTNAVNDVIIATTIAAGGEIADGFGAFRDASAAFGGDPCAAGLLLRPSVPGQPCDVHPSESGREVLAGAIQAVASATGAGFQPGS